MKVAVESNDGATIKSPFTDTKGYLIFDVEENNIEEMTYCRLDKREFQLKNQERGNFTIKECNTIITRGMDKMHREKFRNKGVDVFVTFNTSAIDALHSYLKERIISHATISHC